MTYFEFKREFMGKEFKRNERVIPCVVAWLIYKKGQFHQRPGYITISDKPGWKNGRLFNLKLYEEYLDRLFYER